MKFTSDLIINFPVIDEQHRELFKRLDDVVALGHRAVSAEETEKTLDLLGQYIVKHFRDEEALQVKHNYPKYEWHCGQHKFYIAEYEKLRQEYLKNGPSAQFTLQLNKSVIGWIVRHIKTADRELGKFLNENKA